MFVRSTLFILFKSKAINMMTMRTFKITSENFNGKDQKQIYN
jgi:hypothetical protein